MRKKRVSQSWPCNTLNQDLSDLTDIKDLLNHTDLLRPFQKLVLISMAGLSA